MRLNTILSGNEFEEKAKDILKENGFVISPERVRRISSYDIVAKKEEKVFYIEVKGRGTGNQQRNFCINEIKIERLIECGGEVLFIFINNEGYTICSLDDIINKSPIKINNKKIFIGFNRSFRRSEKNNSGSQTVVDFSEEEEKIIKKVSNKENLNKPKAVKKIVLDYGEMNGSTC